MASGQAGKWRARLVFYEHPRAGLCAYLTGGATRQKLTKAEAMGALADWLEGA